MTWHGTRTWTTDELVTATIATEQWKDNIEILKTVISDLGYPTGALIASLQAADETFNTNTTFDDLGGMSFAIAANETWAFVAVSFCISNGTADVKYTFTAPAGATGRFGVTGAGGAPITAGSTAVFGDPVDVQIPSTVDQTILLGGVVVNGVTAGTVQLQGAQSTSTAVNTIFYENSGIIAARIF